MPSPDLLRARRALGTRVTERLSIEGAVAEFGGGVKGRSALAQAMARTSNKKSKAYKNAMRNLQRYVAGEGKQRRTPKKLAPNITRTVEKQRAKKRIEKMRRRGMKVTWTNPTVKVSDDESPRDDLNVTLRASELSDFYDAMEDGDEQRAIDALSDATLAALKFPGGAYITEADDLILRQR